MNRYCFGKILLTLSVAALLSAASANADIYWESRQISQGVPGIPDGTQIVKNFMTPSATRYEASNNITIIDLDKMKLFALDLKAKTYNEIDLATMGQVPGMDGEAGKQFMGMMKGLLGNVKVVRTKETRTVSGYRCTKYNVSFMGSQSEHWVTQDIKGLDEILKYGKRFSDAMQKNPMMRQMNIPAMLQDLKGFPVETTTKMMNGTMTTTLQKLERKPLPKNLFQLPPGFKKTG